MASNRGGFDYTLSRLGGAVVFLLGTVRTSLLLHEITKVPSFSEIIIEVMYPQPPPCDLRMGDVVFDYLQMAILFANVLVIEGFLLFTLFNAPP